MRTWSGEEITEAEIRSSLQKPRPRIFEKRQQKRDASAMERAVRAAVNIRDHRRCRCCGGKDGLHQHHLTYRSRGGAWSTENIVTVCAGCHALIHARQLWTLGKNADKRITFEIHEAAVVDIFGTRELPPHVRIVTESRRR